MEPFMFQGVSSCFHWLWHPVLQLTLDTHVLSSFCTFCALENVWAVAGGTCTVGAAKNGERGERGRMWREGLQQNRWPPAIPYFISLMFPEIHSSCSHHRVSRPCMRPVDKPGICLCCPMTWAGIHKRFVARKKTGSELIFLRIDFKISFFPFLQMLFTKNASVWHIFSNGSIFLKKNWFF